MDYLDRHNSPYGVEYQKQKAAEKLARRAALKTSEAQARIDANQASAAESGVHSSGVQLPPWAMAQMTQGTPPTGGAPAPQAPTPQIEQLALHARAPKQQQQQALSQALREGV